MDLAVGLLRRGQGQDEEAALALPGQVAERARNLACNVVVDFRRPEFRGGQSVKYCWCICNLYILEHPISFKINMLPVSYWKIEIM